MKRLFMAAMVLLGGAVPSWCLSGADKEAVFFSGLILLQSATSLPAEQKAHKYRELQSLTGISGGKAKTLLALYRDKPEEWQNRCSLINSLLSKVKQPSPAAGSGTEQKNSR
jgi:hypothetical protein